MSNGWIGVDLDGTLAHYDKWVHATHIGAPIEPMLKRVKWWLQCGKDVRILTARVSHDGTADRMLEAKSAHDAIEDWCIEHIGRRLPVACVKDYSMIELWDDRCVQVERNTGLRVDGGDNHV